MVVDILINKLSLYLVGVVCKTEKKIFNQRRPQSAVFRGRSISYQQCMTKDLGKEAHNFGVRSLETRHASFAEFTAA